MFNKPKAPDMSGILTAAMVSMLAGNGSEHTEVNSHTQVWVPVLQAIALAVCLAAWVGGAWLLGAGIVWLARQVGDPALLVMTAFALTMAAYGILGGELWLQRRFKPKLAPSLVLTAAFVAFAVVGTSLLLDTIRLIADWQPWAAFCVAAGVGLIVGSSFLIWRLANELVNPLYPRSPSVDLLREMIGTPEPATRTVIEPFPYKPNGKPAQMMEREPEEPDEPERDLSENFRDLIAFVKRASEVQVGFTRSQWLNAARVTMPSGRRMTRGLYDNLIALGAEHGVIEPGGGGVEASWAIVGKDGERITPEAALDKLIDIGEQALST